MPSALCSVDVMFIHGGETATKCDFLGFPHVLLCYPLTHTFNCNHYFLFFRNQ